jgi:transcriptional regulator with XRE-family HTH domain
VSPQRSLDPSASLAHLFGYELRTYRERANLSQDELGIRVNYSDSLVGQIETARKVPSEEFARKCDEELSADGRLIRLCALLLKRGERFPAWARDYVELEARALEIRTYETQLVPGLLQTEEYARAILRAGRPRDTAEQVEERVAARLGRQGLLTAESPPLLWVVLDEAVLLRPIGGPGTMKGQLQRLVEAADSPHVVMQVLPFAAGAHAALGGSLAIIKVDEGDVAYVEGLDTGRLITLAEDVRGYTLAYDLVRAGALPQAASVAMILLALEGLT